MAAPRELAEADLEAEELRRAVAQLPEDMRIALDPVSYTHLDVYKRQSFCRISCWPSPWGLWPCA